MYGTANTLSSRPSAPLDRTSKAYSLELEILVIYSVRLNHLPKCDANLLKGGVSRPLCQILCSFIKYFGGGVQNHLIMKYNHSDKQIL